ncbi:hypothetical protein EDD86DRAFT_101457 [Gorgonomyces haynaldii]|nr:hypothetical protein EDD86DRAFT_101457 [Gorgonomyces haynaldii]
MACRLSSLCQRSRTVSSSWHLTKCHISGSLAPAATMCSLDKQRSLNLFQSQDINCSVVQYHSCMMLNAVMLSNLSVVCSVPVQSLTLMQSPLSTQQHPSVSRGSRRADDNQCLILMTLDWMSHPNTNACLVTDSILSDCRSPSAMQHLTASHSQSLVAEGQDPLFSDSGVSDENVPIDGSDAMEERQEAVSAQPSSDRVEQSQQPTAQTPKGLYTNLWSII